MSLNIYLVDINPDMCSAWNQLQLPPNIHIRNQSVTTLNLTGTNVYVSPANSFGFMRGGIDGIYAKMFPRIESNVQKAIKSLGYVDADGDSFLPTCSALLVKISNNDYLITCPSMLFPGSYIGDTDNVFHCYRSVLTLIKKLPIKVDNVIIPGIGTGIGGVSFQQCASDFHRAMTDPDIHDETPHINHLVLNTKISQCKIKHEQ